MSSLTRLQSTVIMIVFDGAMGTSLGQNLTQKTLVGRSGKVAAVFWYAPSQGGGIHRLSGGADMSKGRCNWRCIGCAGGYDLADRYSLNKTAAVAKRLQLSSLPPEAPICRWVNPDPRQLRQRWGILTTIQSTSFERSNWATATVGLTLFIVETCRDVLPSKRFRYIEEVFQQRDGVRSRFP